MRKYIVGIKSGTFTLLTESHVKCLKWCRSMCDHLLVIINDNDYLINKKGFCLVDAKSRKSILLELKCVDNVITYTGPNEHEFIKFYKENLDQNTILSIFHSAETHKKDFIPGEGIADRLIFCPTYDGYSTSDLIKTIKENA